MVFKRNQVAVCLSVCLYYVRAVVALRTADTYVPRNLFVSFILFMDPLSCHPEAGGGGTEYLNNNDNYDDNAAKGSPVACMQFHAFFQQSKNDIASIWQTQTNFALFWQQRALLTAANLGEWLVSKPSLSDHAI